MRRRLVGLALALGLLAGCAAGMQYRQIGPTYPPRGSAAAIQLIERGEPAEPYDRIGQITWEYQREKFSPPLLKEILPDLQQKAWEVGGDALVIRELREPANPTGTLRVVADVVRWKR
jgi:hypothetical protein